MKASYGDRHWTPPKGHVDPGENVQQTAFRETVEESGLEETDLIVDTEFEHTILRWFEKHVFTKQIKWSSSRCPRFV